MNSFSKQTFICLSFLVISCRALVPYCYMGEPSFSAPTQADSVFFGDIGTILSIGDTITAGFGAADSSPSSVNEYRGVSFASGNGTDIYSIPNLVSAARGYDYIPGCSTNLINGVRSSGTYYALYDGFNGASKGMEDSFSTQVTFAVTQATNYFGSTSYNSKWKLVIAYMGLFKACDICNTISAGNQALPAFWQTYYSGVISTLTAQFSSKAIINLIGLPKISQFYSSGSSACKTYNQNNNICPCLWTLNTTTLDNIINAANSGMKAAITAWRTAAGATSSVGIIYQPFLTNTVFPSTTLSAVDCFHPNTNGHKLMTTGLWNNLKQFASTDKSTSVTTTTTLNCDDSFSPLVDLDSPY